MKIQYMFSYGWKTVVNRQDRLFSFLNILSVTATMFILIALTGLLYSFKTYSETILDKLPFRVEVFKTKDSLVQDLSALEPQILALPAVKGWYKRIPTSISFFPQGKASSMPIEIQGSTLSPQEPYLLKDIHGENVGFLGKEALKAPFDEVGILVSFEFLKKLGFLEANVYFEKRETWEKKQLPSKIKIQVSNRQNILSDLDIPVVGIVSTLERGDYLVTEDFYNLLLAWQEEFGSMLFDRNHKPLVLSEPEIIEAYYVLTDDEYTFLEEKEQLLSQYDKKVQMTLSLTIKEDNALWLSILPLQTGQKLSTLRLTELDLLLRSQDALKNMAAMQKREQRLAVRSWKDMTLPAANHQYIHAALYLKDRQGIEGVLEKLRGWDLFASSPLERYLKTFSRQEQFFTGAAVVIFSLVLFLSGIVLFSTFYSTVLRKKKEIGIFKAYGASSFLVLFLFYIQSTMLLVVGCFLGIVGGLQLGVLLSQWLNHFAHLQEGGLTFHLPFSYVFDMVLLMLITTWIAIFIPAKIAISIDPADVVRG